jgi:polyisoprenoid-binding protein YceI
MARRDGLDSEANPIARWTIQQVEPTGERTFNAHGLLRFRGADHPLSLEVTFNGLKRHPLTLRRTAGFSARATLSRAALGLHKWSNMVGDAVQLQVEVEARRGRQRDDHRAGAADAGRPASAAEPTPPSEAEPSDAATQPS